MSSIATAGFAVSSTLDHSRGSQPNPFPTKRAAESNVLPLRWAWSGRLLARYLNFIVGEEGCGKGVTLCHLISAATRGALEGDFYGKPSRVLIIGDEDGWEDVWVPRLIAAGADLDRVMSINSDEDIDIFRDIERLRATIAGAGVRFVIFDQLLDQLGVAVNDFKSKQVRKALHPFRRLTKELELVGIAVLHMNKAEGASFRQRVAGSHAFNALSRSTLLLAEHPDDPDRRVLIGGKRNYSRAPEPLEFAIASRQLTINGHKFDLPVVEGLEVSDVLLDDALQRERPTTKIEAARVFVLDILSDRQWHAAKDIYNAAEAEGFGERLVRRAADNLIEHEKGFGGAMRWRLL